MKTPLYILPLAILLLLSSCEPFELQPAKSAVDIVTGDVERSPAYIVASELRAVGDGVKFYGHVWSKETRDIHYREGCTECDTIAAPSAEWIGEFEGELILPEVNTKYYYRAFMVDVNDLYWPGAIDSVVTGENPIARFSIDYVDGEDNFCFAPCTVQFTNESSNYTKFAWDFGDGSPIDSINDDPAHRYLLPQSGDAPYKVKLTVSNENSDPVADSMLVNVRMFKSVLPVFTHLGIPVGAYELSNGSFLIAGSNLSIDEESIYVAIIDRFGNELSSETFAVSGLQTVSDIIRLSDGSFAMTGSALGSGTDDDTVEHNLLFFRFQIDNPAAMPDIVPLNNSPRVLRHNDDTVLDDRATTLVELQSTSSNDRHLILIGTRRDTRIEDDEEDLVVAILASDFSNLLGVPFELSRNGAHRPKAAIPISNNRALILGSVKRGENRDAFVTSFDFELNFTAEHTYGGNAEEQFNNAMRDEDGNYLLGGYSTQNGNRDFYFVRVNNTGQEAGTQIPIKAASGTDEIESMLLANGSFFLAGRQDRRPALMHYTSTGNPIWSEVQKYGSGNGHFTTVILTPDGGLLAIGHLSNNLFVVKTDPNGGT